MFETKYEESTKTLTCNFSGRLDGIATKEIEEKLNTKLSEVVEGNTDIKVVFEMKDVDYIASAFIRVCIATAKEVKEDNFSIIDTNPTIKKTFKMAGLDTVLNVS